MRRLIAPALFLLLFLGCGSSDDPVAPPAIPAAATAMDAKLTSDIDMSMPRVVRFETILVFIMNPGTPLAQGVTLAPDTSPGMPPHSFTFSGTYDGNDDGFRETTMSGRATFNVDPALAWSGVTGQATVDVAIPVIGHVYRGNINYSITSASEQLSGSGTFTNPVTGTTTTMTVPAATPLVVKPATGAADAISNGCGYSLSGPIGFEVTSSSGTLRTTWNFSPNSASVAVNNRTFTSSSGVTTVLPDSAVEARCGGGRSINDWVGSYDQLWACLPRETGRATITMSVSASDTVTINDEDPPGSGDLSTYTATTIGGNPHALRGFFIAGPQGFRYREDFNWTMRRSLSGFAQSSKYVYIEGPNQGTGGFCVASAPRL